MIAKLNLEESLNRDWDVYPKTLASAANALSEHPFDPAYKEKKKKDRQSRNDSNRQRNSDRRNEDEQEDEAPPLGSIPKGERSST